MNSHWREEEFITYLDARLEPAERARLDAHLGVCEQCRGRLEEMRALGRVLEEWKPPAASADFDARLRARLEQEHRVEGRTGWSGWLVLRPAYGVALAAAVLGALGIALWQPSAPEPGQPLASRPVAVEHAPSPQAPAAQAPSVASAAGGDLAVLDNPVLLENYDLLEEFDILFEPLEKERDKSL